MQPHSAGPPPEADAVVIGAGAFGICIAYHLARQGRRNIVLIDRHGLASQTPPRAAGLSAAALRPPLSGTLKAV
jgi:glycine/D-amino acid oxidase-like deaminating enzyme